MAQSATITWDAWGGAWGSGVANAWGVSWINTQTPVTARARGYDPRREIILADDLKIIEYVEDFLRRQPWRR